MSLLKMRTVPLDGESKPHKIEINVVFPAPLGPNKPQNAPRSIVRQGRSKTTGPVALYFLLRFLISIVIRKKVYYSVADTVGWNDIF